MTSGSRYESCINYMSTDYAMIDCKGQKSFGGSGIYRLGNGYEVHCLIIIFITCALGNTELFVLLMNVKSLTKLRIQV